MKLTFFGACRQVTGSSYLVETDSTRVLIDCGMIQGEKFSEEENYKDFPFDPTSIDAVVVTHAHIDHCGRIPKLVRDGFSGQILSTPATLDLIQLMLTDSAHVIAQEAKEHKHAPLYLEEDVSSVMTMTQAIEYGEQYTIGDIRVTPHDAGHILGSAFIELSNGQRSIVFSGDLGNSPVPLLRETEPLPNVDYLVMESTYGDRLHEGTRERKLLLCSAIYETVTMGGTLLIPAFSLERTQELLYELNELVNNKDIPAVPIFLDSPLAIKATRVYPKYNHLFDQAASYLLDSGDDVFNFAGLRMTESVVDSKSINSVTGPKVVIAGSGMMQGGRIQHHLKRYLSDFRNQVLVIGYQASRTLGRKILEGEPVVLIGKETVPVKAKIRAIGGYSAHADRDKLLQWVQTAKQPPRHIWLTHGEETSATSLAAYISEHTSIVTSVPEYGQVEDLSVSL